MQNTYSKSYSNKGLHQFASFLPLLSHILHVAMLSPDFLLLPCIYSLEIKVEHILVAMQTQGESYVFSLVVTIHNL